MKYLPIPPCKIAQAWSDWIESVCKQQFSSLARDSQVDLGLDCDWAVLTHEYALSKPFHCSSGCMFRLAVLLEGELQPPSNHALNFSTTLSLTCLVCSLGFMMLFVH